MCTLLPIPTSTWCWLVSVFSLLQEFLQEVPLQPPHLLSVGTSNTLRIPRIPGIGRRSARVRFCECETAPLRGGSPRRSIDGFLALLAVLHSLCRAAAEGKSRNVLAVDAQPSFPGGSHVAGPECADDYGSPPFPGAAVVAAVEHPILRSGDELPDLLRADANTASASVSAAVAIGGGVPASWAMHVGVAQIVWVTKDASYVETVLRIEDQYRLVMWM